MYRRCLEVNPEHSYALYNLAVLKEETMTNGDYTEVRKFGTEGHPSRIIIIFMVPQKELT